MPSELLLCIIDRLVLRFGALPVETHFFKNLFLPAKRGFWKNRFLPEGHFSERVYTCIWLLFRITILTRLGTTGYKLLSAIEEAASLLYPDIPVETVPKKVCISEYR